MAPIQGSLGREGAVYRGGGDKNSTHVYTAFVVTLKLSPRLRGNFGIFGSIKQHCLSGTWPRVDPKGRISWGLCSSQPNVFMALVHGGIESQRNLLEELDQAQVWKGRPWLMFFLLQGDL